MKLVRLRRPEITYSPSYADYRPNTNAAILWDRNYIKESYAQEG
jgi:hypothetical protein